jgi:hypothetical protein
VPPPTVKVTVDCGAGLDNVFLPTLLKKGFGSKGCEQIRRR